MYGPYSAILENGKKIISYKGNAVFKPIDNIEKHQFSEQIIEDRLDGIANSKNFYHLHRIDNAIFFASVEYFRKIGADWCNLPLTTLMISSPGEIYAGKKLDYTTDTLPIDISWFDTNRKIFLSESSQFYLEMRLLMENVEKVFCIYNSFRKEKADFCHLSEFQHIEFEGKISFEKNIKIALDLLGYISKYLVKNYKKDLLYFLSENEVASIEKSFDSKNFTTLTFQEVLELLYKDTGNECYKEFSLRNFGAWEEIRATGLVGGHLIITEFPIIETPFYHNVVKYNKEGLPLAENVDIILYGFRETIGGGMRISDEKALLQKAEFFNLPLDDYAPYLKIRSYSQYEKTAGFGLGWQRFTHWLLKLPYIWESTHIPRGHYLPKL